MFVITLDSGRRVSVNGIHVSSTYAGVLEGKPDAALSTWLIDSAPSKMVGTWGERPTHVIQPDVLPGNTSERLPAEQWFAWLDSTPIHDPTAFGSELVVVWFCDASEGLTLRDIIERSVRCIEWEALAADYDF